MKTVRSAAAELLQRCRSGRAFAPELLDQWLAEDTVLSGPDRRLLTQLVCGVIRRRATLDALIQPLVERPWSAVEPVLQDLLRLGAYQLVVLTHIPAYAAVDATVSAAGELGWPRAKGFLNAVLRRLAALVSEDFVSSPAADAVPLDESLPLESWSADSPPLRYRRLRQALLPDPQEQSLEYLAAAFSLPRSLVSRWLERQGWQETIRWAAWFNAPPPLWLRVQTRRVSREAFRDCLAAAGIASQPGPHPQSLYLPDPPPVRQIPGYAEGKFTVQDLSAMLVASALEPHPGMRILDLCAAPGGKTTHLAELMNDQGHVLACDIHPRRLETLRRLAQRLGLNCIEPHLLHPQEPPPSGPFDAVLVDAPCSNTGVLHRRPEARWRWRTQDLKTLTRRQAELLRQALAAVRPGGTLVYATCSLEPEENERLIQELLRAFPRLEVDQEYHAIPGRPADGGYHVRLHCR